LLQPCHFILFDETFSKIDPSFLDYVGKALRLLVQSGTSVMVVSHDLNFLSEWVDRLMLIHSGRVLSLGTFEEVVHPENLSLLFPQSNPELVRSSRTGKLKVLF